MNYEEITEALDHEENFGILAEASTSEIVVYSRNEDTSIGDLFLIPSDRGGDRVYIFRMTQYANALRREDEMSQMAKNTVAMPDAYRSDDFDRDKLLRLSGTLLGYSEAGDDEVWHFRAPRKLPAHLSKVYKVGFGSAENVARQETCLRELLGRQLQHGVQIGALLAGETALESVQVSMPGEYFAHHLGIFGRTGTGKSNNLMVLIESILTNNQRLFELPRDEWLQGDRPVSLFAIDPHDEFARWKPGSRGGITRIVQEMSSDQHAGLIDPFFYLSCRSQEILDSDTVFGGRARSCTLHRNDITPTDLISIMEFSDVMAGAAEAIGDFHGEGWISSVLSGDVEVDENVISRMSLSAINRRLGFLAGNRSNLVPNHRDYDSAIPDIIIALERGRVLDVDTTLMTEIEQFLLTTIVARTIFALRKALKSSRNLVDLIGDDEHPGEIDRHLPMQDTLKDRLRDRLSAEDSPYLDSGRLRRIDELPAVNIIIEEAPSILNPARIKFGSVFRDISRQGRKFGVGLTVVSQQVTEIDKGILSQLNTEISMALGNEDERRAAVQTASNDIFAFKRELQVMGVGQAILSASYKNVPLPVQIPEFR